MADEKLYSGNKMPKFYVNQASHMHATLKEMADTFKKELRIRGFKPKGTPVTDEYGTPREKQMGRDNDGNPIMVPVTYTQTMPDYKKEVELTGEDKDDLDAINRKLSKPLALSVIRLVYIAEEKHYNYQNIFNILSFPKPYAGANSLAPMKVTEPYEYPWQNFRGRRNPWRAEEMFEEYVEREGLFPHIPGREWLSKWEDGVFWSSTMEARKLFRMLYEGFFHPFSHPTPEDVIVLNLEEIATMWHLPGAVATTPTLPRIDSAKGVAPVNLPQ